nr:hypothetical protein HK105_000045 [Polyrhizophydium stewartii]
MQLYGRPRVPHDFHRNKYTHSHTCAEAPGGTVAKSLSYTVRSRGTTFGKSNRIPFLRAMSQCALLLWIDMVAEQERLTHLPFIDEEEVQRRRNYKLKIMHFVRDKNVQVPL